MIGICKACKRGQNQMCPNAKINGFSLDGGCKTSIFSIHQQVVTILTPLDAEYCILNSEAVVRLPSDCDPAKYAPLLCAGVTVFNAMRNMHISPGETVAIQGLGGLGHLAVQYAARMGYRAIGENNVPTIDDSCFDFDG